MLSKTMTMTMATIMMMMHDDNDDNDDCAKKIANLSEQE